MNKKIAELKKEIKKLGPSGEIESTHGSIGSDIQKLKTINRLIKRANLERQLHIEKLKEKIEEIR